MGRGLEVLYMKSSTWRRIQDTRVRAIQADDIEVVDAEIHVGMYVGVEEILFRREEKSLCLSVGGDCFAQSKTEIFKFSCGATLHTSVYGVTGYRKAYGSYGWFLMRYYLAGLF